MIRTCAACGVDLLRVKFTRSQWMKGNGESKCKSCVEGLTRYSCRTCQRSFASNGDLAEHLLVHYPRTPACSFCGDKRVVVAGFTCPPLRSILNGGRGNMFKPSNEVYRKIYKHACQQHGMKPEAMPSGIDNDDGDDDGSSGQNLEEPMRPTSCPDCTQLVSLFSQLVVLSQYSKAGREDDKVPVIQGGQPGIQAEARGIRDV